MGAAVVGDPNGRAGHGIHVEEITGSGECGVDGAGPRWLEGLLLAAEEIGG